MEDSENYVETSNETTSALSSNSLIDRAGAAIDDELMRWGLGLQNIKMGRALARAAFTAMREPSDEMITAEALILLKSPSECEFVWKAMIDGALK